MIVWDVVVSAVGLVLTALVVAAGVLAGVFSLAFLGPCPPATCNGGAAFAAVTVSLLLAAAAGIGGLVGVVARVVRRRHAWPFALGALVLAVLLLGLGAAVFARVTGA